MLSWSDYIVEVTSASVSAFLTEANNLEVRFRNIRYVDDLCVCVSVSAADYCKLQKLALKRGDSLKIVGRQGAYFLGMRILKRPVLLVGIVLWLFLVVFLPSRVLFVRIEGNHAVETVTVMEAAEKSGIRFGASRRYVRSEKVKNTLLSEINALQWAGVNTYGCVAVISVKEREIPAEILPDYAANSIVAARDGVISAITVTKGNSLCKAGQAVRSGQVLVSGYTDCGLSVRVERAEAEVTALTSRSLTALTLLSGVKRTSINEINVRYSIQIGKNVVKLYKDSGISDASCVKIYSQKYLTLPGGFELPVSVIKETLYSYDCQDDSLTNEGEFDWVRQSVESYLQNVMVAGRILRGSVNGEFTDGVYCLNGKYTCEEMIGQVRIEEIGGNNGERNR